MDPLARVLTNVLRILFEMKLQIRIRSIEFFGFDWIGWESSFEFLFIKLNSVQLMNRSSQFQITGWKGNRLKEGNQEKTICELWDISLTSFRPPLNTVQWALLSQQWSGTPNSMWIDQQTVTARQNNHTFNHTLDWTQTFRSTQTSRIEFGQYEVNKWPICVVHYLHHDHTRFLSPDKHLAFCTKFARNSLLLKFTIVISSQMPNFALSLVLTLQVISILRLI